MKKILYIGLILVALISCKSKDGTITGTAIANGTHAGITVKLYSTETQLLKTTTTDESGRFEFSNLVNENYFVGATIVIGTDTYDTGNLPQIVYVNDKIVKEVALTLTKK